MNTFEPAAQGVVLPSKAPVSIILIPYWIRQALDRNKLNHIEILNYDTIRKILSIEDIAQLVCSNQLEKHPILGRLLMYKDLTKVWSATMSGAYCKEYLHVILPLSQAEQTYQAVVDRLMDTTSRATIGLSFETMYRIQVASGDMFTLYIEQGLFNALEDRVYAKSFISDYLKALYSLIPMSDVSKCYPAFEQYFNLL